jgi:hypothetical protein
MSQLPPDDEQENIEPEDDGFGSHEPPNNEQLGLPDDYDPRYIPSPEDLRQAATDALDREFSFLILNHEKPETIVERLEDIVDIALAACEVTGDHQVRAIRLGLALELQYWLAGGKLAIWEKRITTMLLIALRLKNYELLSRIYEAWGMYSAIVGENSRADTALLNALECADDSNREDIRLLMRAEYFKLKAPTMEVDPALVEARIILAEARRLKYYYVQGRIHLSLARAYQLHSYFEQAFTYAQQALIFAAQEEDIALETQATSIMLGTLMRLNNHSRSYCARLLLHLDALAQRSVNPWFQFLVQHQNAVDYYHRADYDQARKSALRAWAIARQVKVGLEGIRSEHMLGLIQSKRRCWQLAQSHLNASYRWYQGKGQIAASFDVKHAQAYILYEQGDLAGALVELKKLLAEVQDWRRGGQARDHLIQNIQDDIESITRELNTRLVSTR